MGNLWDKMTSQFVEIIEWTDNDHKTMFWRFPVRGQEIKNGAQLIVREGQTAALVSEGKLADMFAPGTHTLTTQNLPVLATLKGWKYGFNSPFKSEVYFFATTVFTDLKWGTQNPIMLRDPEIGPLRLRAFGSFALRIADPTLFLRMVGGADGQFELEEILGQLKRTMVSRFTTALGQAKVPALDLAGNYDDLAQKLMPVLTKDFEELGLSLAKFLIENISLPQNVEVLLDKRSEIGIIGNMQQFAAFQAATAIPDAARAQNSMAGAGMGLAVGLGMGAQMASVLGLPGTPASAASPSLPAPTGESSANQDTSAMVERLKKLDALKIAGVLTEDEYRQKRSEILASL